MKMTIWYSTTTLLIFLLAMASPAVYGAEIIVGNNSGWTRPFDYDAWAAARNFTVGDTLLFNYDSSHRLDVVNKASYDDCGISNPISTHNDGKTKIPLSQPGPMYFICPVPGHCDGGMKLQITVASANTTPSGSPPSTSPSPPSSSNTPSSPPTSPTTTTTSPPPPPSGVGSIVCNMYNLGISLVLVTLVSLMG